MTQPVPDLSAAFPLIGTQYWRAPTPPPAEWDDDLRAVARLGLEAIQLRVQWSWHERNEGELDFGEVVRLMDLAHSSGLGCVVKIMLEDAPYWLYEDYDAARVGPDGRAIPPVPLGSASAGLVMPCFDRPLVRRKAEPFIRGLAEATAGHPALLFYSLWNEIRSRPYGQCACPDSRRKFEEYLRGRFGTVERMNRELGKDFGRFSHFRPPAGLTDHTSPLVWRSWCRDTLADTLGWVKSIVRQAAPQAAVVVHAGMCNMINSALGDATSDRRNAAVVDLFGHSGVFWTGRFHSYQRIEGKATRGNPDWRDHQYILSMQDRWTRHVCGEKPAMNYEVYGNDYGGLNPDFAAADVHDFVLTSLAEGVRLLMIWQYKSERIGQEVDSAGLVRMDGSMTERAEAVGRLAGFVRANRALLGGYAPEPGQVALVYDETSDLLSALQDHGESGETGSDLYGYKNNLKGWYRLFWDAHIPADPLDSQADADWAAYRLIVLPAMLHVGPELRRRIGRYVAGGGRLIVDCGFDTRQANGWANPRSPADDLRALLGGVSADKQLLAGPADRLDSPFGPLPVGQYVAVLSSSDGLWRSHQAGRTMFFAFNPGEARYFHPRADFGPFYAWLADWAGLRPDRADLRIRKGTSSGRPVWFVHNLSDRPADFPLPGARDLLAGADHIGPDGWAVLTT